MPTSISGDISELFPKNAYSLKRKIVNAIKENNMSTVSISEGNKMIAEFMGLYRIGRDHPFQEPNGIMIFGNGQYHSSWDWLMSPVQKFLSRKPETEWTQMLRGALTTTEIKTVWDALISAIKSANE